jgi:hypothetical protein
VLNTSEKTNESNEDGRKAHFGVISSKRLWAEGYKELDQQILI